MKFVKDAAISRRSILLGAAASGLTLKAGTAFAQNTPPLASPVVRRNSSGFAVANWEDHFDNLKHGVILCDIDSRACSIGPKTKAFISFILPVCLSPKILPNAGTLA